MKEARVVYIREPETVTQKLHENFIESHPKPALSKGRFRVIGKAVNRTLEEFSNCMFKLVGFCDSLVSICASDLRSSGTPAEFGSVGVGKQQMLDSSFFSACWVGKRLGGTWNDP